jgi:hypothetical protein
MTTAALNSALRLRLDLLEDLWRRDDAEGITHELYTDATEITGAGTEALYTGNEALTEVLRGLVSGSESVQIRIDRLHALGELAAYTWVTWTVQVFDGEPFLMKSLFVWELTGKGWRIVADMYAEGEIPA